MTIVFVCEPEPGKMKPRDLHNATILSIVFSMFVLLFLKSSFKKTGVVAHSRTFNALFLRVLAEDDVGIPLVRITVGRVVSRKDHVFRQIPDISVDCHMRLADDDQNF